MQLELRGEQNRDTSHDNSGDNDNLRVQENAAASIGKGESKDARGILCSDRYFDGNINKKNGRVRDGTSSSLVEIMLKERNVRR